MPEEIKPDALYCPDDLAPLLKVRASAIRDWIRRGWLPAKKLGKRYWIRGADLLELMSAQRDKKER